MSKRFCNNIRYCCAWMLFWAGAPAFCGLLAQNSYKIIGVEDGLSQGYVTTIFQDKTGYIWIGTFNGLNRYDGYNIKRYTPNPFDPWALNSSSLIVCLYEDENHLMWVGTHDGLMIFDPVSEHFFNLSLVFPDFPKGHIGQITSDKQGAIIFQLISNLETQLFYRLRANSDLLSKIRHKKAIQAEDFNVKLLDERGDVFTCLYGSLGDTLPLVSGKNGKIYQYNSRTDQLEYFDTSIIPNNGTAESCIFWLNNSRLGYWFRYMKPDGQYEDMHSNVLPRALPLGSGKLGMYVSESGAFFIKNNNDPLLQQQVVTNRTYSGNRDFLSAFTPYTTDPISIKFNESVMVDQRGGLWLGTGGWGVITYTLLRRPFRHLKINNQAISTIKTIHPEKLWVRLYDNNHKFLDPNTFETLPAPWHGLPGVPSNIQELFVDSQNNYWLVEHGKGESDYNKLYTWNSTTRKFYLFPDKLPYLRGITENIIEDSWHNIWIGCSNGKIYRARAGSRQLETFEYRHKFQLPELALRTTSMYQHSTGELWIGTNAGLILVPNPDADQPDFRLFQHKPSDKHTLVMNWVTCFCPDPTQKDLVWIGTRGGGMCRMNMRTYAFIDYISETPGGLPDNVVYGILPDNNGNLWCSTNRGLCRFHPKDRVFTTYQSSDGLISTEFNTNSYAKSADGRMWFGGIFGLNAFHPDSIVTRTKAPGVTITGIKVGGGNRNLESPYSLTLRYNENNITIEFSALDFTNPQSNRFKYRLIGADNQWSPASNINHVNFAALAPGKYVFELLGATADSPWSDHPYQFELIILPPWYHSSLAYIFYLATGLLLLWGGIKLREHQYQIRQEAALSQLESERLKAFDGVKNRFFANVAHELRTPLTVILGLAERIKSGNDPVEIREIIPKIIRQSKHLLDLSTQLMDLAKLESRQVHVRYTYGNIHGFVLQETDALQPLAEKKDIRLEYHSDCPDLSMDFDAHNIQKIINNLVANAIRHSKRGDTVSISTTLDRQGRFVLSVADQGEGIHPDDLPHIFDRYFQGARFQAQTGASGIGLTITRELTQLMGGSIQAESEWGKGATFRVVLPVASAHKTVDASDRALLQTGFSPETTTRQMHRHQEQKPLLLIVEDNEDVLDYLKRALSAHYNIIEAENGLQGIKVALEQMPDIVITDVSMPVMDGLEFTHKMKADIRSSHIPIVMLTARVDTSDRVEGHLRGANAYLAKPVLEEELLLVLHNLIQLREQWKNRYGFSASSGIINTQQPVDSSADDITHEDRFMQILFQIFEENLPNETLDLSQLCKLLNMSSSQLDRKLKTLTDQSPMEMLRRFRLHKARAILAEQPDISVSEVCFSTGFKNPAHFSRLFHKEFGYPPSRAGKKKE